MGIKILVVVTIFTIIFVANLFVNKKHQRRYKKR